MNLFAAQTLTGAISRSLHLAPEFSGLAAMVPQLGYAVGLVLLVPLCDLLENRRLIVRTLACGAGFLAGRNVHRLTRIVSGRCIPGRRRIQRDPDAGADGRFDGA